MSNIPIDEMKKIRNASYDIDPLIITRWSPRAISDEPVTDEELSSLFEAARLAPSCYNEQPWRFIIAKKKEDIERFTSFLAEGNKLWAPKAKVLIVMISKKTFTYNEKPNRFHSFDTGTAWGYLTIEGERKGLLVHGMGGFDPDAAREVLKVPDDYEINAVAAIGKPGSKDLLPPKLQEKEKPGSRKELKEICFEGSFSG